jgi:hypothetical protein
MLIEIRPLFIALPIAMSLVATGCGSDAAPSSTTISGQVVKGPVNGSSVCVYAITGAVRATSTIVPCVVSDTNGNYTFTSFPYTGDVIIEATGGTYRNEATGANTTLSAPLRTIVPAQGGSITGLVTPLTTVAYGSTSTLTSAAFAQSAGNVAAQAGLAGTNILTAIPTFAGANGITATNAYAAVLGAFAQYQQAGGFNTAQALSAWTPANQGAFQAAVSAYAAYAGVIAANLPAAFNFAATGSALSFTAASAVGTGPAATAGGIASAPTVSPAVNGQRLLLTYSAATGDFSGSALGIDLPEGAASAFPGTVNAVTPSYSQTSPARQVQFTFASPGGTGIAVISPGNYTVGSTTGLWATTFYNEGAANGWEGTSGTLVIDNVVGDVIAFRFVDVRMVPSRRFGSTLSAGSFTYNGAGKARISCLSAAQCL